MPVCGLGAVHKSDKKLTEQHLEQNESYKTDTVYYFSLTQTAQSNGKKKT